MTTHTKKTETPAITTATTGTAAPSKGVAEALKLLDQAAAALALDPLQNLTTKQRKAAMRSRKGMEKVVPTLATLSAEHGVAVPKQSTAVMTSQMEAATQLDTVQQKLVGLTTLVANNADTVRSAAWMTASTLYGMMQPVARRDAQLKAQLAPVKSFFAYRTPAAKKEHPKQKGKKAALAAAKTAGAAANTGAVAETAGQQTAAQSSGAATGAVVGTEVANAAAGTGVVAKGA
jgi:hypothetical protein